MKLSFPVSSKINSQVLDGTSNSVYKLTLIVRPLLVSSRFELPFRKPLRQATINFWIWSAIFRDAPSAATNSIGSGLLALSPSCTALLICSNSQIEPLETTSVPDRSTFGVASLTPIVIFPALRQTMGSTATPTASSAKRKPWHLLSE